MKRRSGQSTKQALEAIARAIQFPGEEVVFTDHAEEKSPGNARWTAEQVRRIIVLLALEDMTVDYDSKLGTIYVISKWKGIKHR